MIRHMASEVEWWKVSNAVQNIMILSFVCSHFFVILKYLFGIKWWGVGGCFLLNILVYWLLCFIWSIKRSQISPGWPLGCSSPFSANKSSHPRTAEEEPHHYQCVCVLSDLQELIIRILSSVQECGKGPCLLSLKKRNETEDSTWFVVDYLTKLGQLCGPR